MKYKEIAEKKIPDLVTQVEKVQKELSQLMLDIRMGKSNKTSKIKSIKKDLARLLTAKKQQELRVGK
ncbi:MAG: 50S ribosomal protein L29 [Deltaproteobacteria bacterium]|nr:MAG: 50S ribosomal protein L29 [Deltaproteobacteria bacterium]